MFGVPPSSVLSCAADGLRRHNSRRSASRDLKAPSLSDHSCMRVRTQAVVCSPECRRRSQAYTEVFDHYTSSCIIRGAPDTRVHSTTRCLRPQHYPPPRKDRLLLRFYHQPRPRCDQPALAYHVFSPTSSSRVPSLKSRRSAGPPALAARRQWWWCSHHQAITPCVADNERFTSWRSPPAPSA
jgi:hypothetical protein